MGLSQSVLRTLKRDCYIYVENTIANCKVLIAHWHDPVTDHDSPHHRRGSDVANNIPHWHYCAADHAAHTDDRKSISGYTVLVGGAGLLNYKVHRNQLVHQ
jgi:hypothetical protein